VADLRIKILLEKAGVGSALESEVRGLGTQLQSAGSGIDDLTRRIERLGGSVGRFDQMGTSVGNVTTRVNALAQSMERLNAASTHTSIGPSGGTASLQGHLGVLQQIGGAWNTIGRNALAVYATIRDIEFIGRGMRDLIAGPFDKITAATDDYRKFRVGISGVAGGADRAAAIDDSLLQATRDIPLTLRQVREIGLEMSKVAGMSSSISLGSPAQVAQNVSDWTTTIGRLSALNPQETPDRIAAAVTQALEGQSRSFRRTLQIDPAELGRLVGAKPTDFTGDPQLLMGALGKYLDLVAPSGVASGRGELVSVLAQKMNDIFTIAAQKIGDQGGLYDHIRDQMNNVFHHAFDYVTSAQGGDRFKSIGESMSKTFDSLGESLLTLAERAVGAKDLNDLPDAVARAVQGVSATISKWSQELPGIASDVGAGVHSIAESLKWLAEQLGSINKMATRPGDATAGFMSSWLDDKRLRIDPEERKRRQLESIQGGLTGLGLGGTSIDDYSTSSPILNLGGFRLGEIIHHNYALGTGNIKSPQRAGLAQQLIKALEGMDPDALQNPDATYTHDAILSRARDVIPGFDDKLAAALGQGRVPGTYHLPANINAMFGQAKGEGYLEPAYATRFRSATDAATGISQWADTSDKLNADLRLGAEKLKDLQGGAGGVDAFTRIAQFRDAADSYLSQMIDALRAEAGKDPSHAKDLGKMIADLTTTQQKNLEQAQAESDELAKDVVGGIGRFGAELSRDVASGGNAYAADVTNLWIQGRTAIQQQAAKLLAAHGYLAGGAGALGLNAIPPAQRAAFLNESIKANLASIGTFGGRVDLSRASASDLYSLSSRPVADSLIGGQGVAGAQLDYLRSVMPLLQGNFTGLQSRFNALGPGADPKQVEELRRAMDQAGEAVATTAAKIRQLSVESNNSLKSIVEFGNSLQGSLENGTTGLLDSLGKGAAGVKQSIRSMVESVIHDFNTLSTHLLFGNLFGNPSGQPGVGQGIGGLFGLLFGLHGQSGPVTSAGETPPPFQPPVLDVGPAATAARGAVWGGGFTPFAAFANGGIARTGGATLGLIGEAGPEAVIPLRGVGGSIPLGADSQGNIFAHLPSGQRVPASFSGYTPFAGGGVVGGGYGSGAGAAGIGGVEMHSHVYVVANEDEAKSRAAVHADLRNHVTTIVARDIRTGGQVHKAMRQASNLFTQG
jgi:hypothetical protein